MLEVINASKTFAKGTPNEHKALDHLNLSLKEGEFVTILGSNGAGKSTLFNAIWDWKTVWLRRSDFYPVGRDR